MQYPQKDLHSEDMDWREFKVLLAGLGVNTPLGQIISIRSEDDPNMISSFTKDQKRIRDEYRKKQNKRAFVNDQVKDISNVSVQDVLSNLFG